jgi:hypothetical protein
MSLTYLDYKGKRILFVDYTKCQSTQDTLDVLEKVRMEYMKSNELMLALNDFTGAVPNNEYMDLAKKYAKEIFDVKTLKNACLGITGVKKILLSAYNLIVKNKLMPFDTKEEALEYLVK